MKPKLLALGLLTAGICSVGALPAQAGTPQGTAKARSSAARSYRAADLEVDGYSVWLGNDGKLDRVVVMVEGFDLYNRMNANDLMHMVAPVANRLLEEGLDALVVDFPDSHLAPDTLAPILERAIRSAAKASGAPVAVAGLSGGGIVSRWALSAAEAADDPLPVHTLMLLDSPNRPARLNPALQAMVLRYGGKLDREAISCPMAKALLDELPTDIHWRRIGLPGLGRRIPESWTPDRDSSRKFYQRLHALNDNRGYPRKCRVIALAQGSREDTRNHQRCELFRIWLPGGSGWISKAAPEDLVAGSLLPPLMVEQFRIRMPLGLAGSYLRTVPTFLPTESALDATADEAPPFDEWYARPGHLPAVPHDSIGSDTATLVCQVLIRCCKPAPTPAAH